MAEGELEECDYPGTPTSLPSDESTRDTVPLNIKGTFTLLVLSGEQRELRYDSMTSVGWVYAQIKEMHPSCNPRMLRLVHGQRLLRNMVVKLADVFDGYEKKTLSVELARAEQD